MATGLKILVLAVFADIEVARGEVLLNGIRQIHAFSPIWRGLGEGLNGVLAPTSKAEVVLYGVSLSADEGSVFSLVNGKLTVQQIVTMSYLSNFETVRMLFALRMIGAIEPRAADLEATEPPADDYELEECIERYNRFLGAIYQFISERLEELVNHFMDSALANLDDPHRGVLRHIKLHQQGRVEYEQIYANLGGLDSGERQQRVTTTLDELLVGLLELTRKELGPDEAEALVEQLNQLSSTAHGVPIAALARRLKSSGSC